MIKRFTFPLFAFALVITATLTFTEPASAVHCNNKVCLVGEDENGNRVGDCKLQAGGPATHCIETRYRRDCASDVCGVQ